MSDTEVYDNPPQDSQVDSATEFFRMQMGVNFSNDKIALLEKVTSEHIGKMIDASARDEQEMRKLQSRKQWMNLLYVVIAVAVFVFIVIFLRTDADLLVRVITIAASFLGGLGTGFTLSKRKSGD